MKLTDVKWMDAELAARLEKEGVTVQIMASMDSADFLVKYPFVGTINAWLLTSEARYLINIEGLGLWEPEKQKQEGLAREIEALGSKRYVRRPPTILRAQLPPEYSVRIRRIRASQGLD